MKQVLLALTLIVIFFLLWKWYNKRELSAWDKKFPYLINAGWKEYEAIQIIPHDLTYQSGIFLSDSANNLGHGHLFYDQQDGAFWGEIVTDTYHWIKISSEGKVVLHDSLNTEIFKNMTLLLPLVNQTEWEDTLYPLKMNKFIKEQFNWGVLNPLRNVGNTTGEGSAFYWEGTSYLTLDMADEKISFRTRNRLGEYGYDFRIAFCYLPNMEKQSALVYVEDQHWEKADRGLYIIRKKK